LRQHVLVVGSGGLVGRALIRQGFAGLSRTDCDVTVPSAREAALERYLPDAVIFCAARTDVDACERDPVAWRVNVEAPAEWARRVPTWLVSSNYVFSGPGPHRPGDARRPLQAYGRQKAAAEDAVLSAGGHVVRTGWLYGEGGVNLPSRLPELLRSGAVRAIDDRSVQPTWVDDLAVWLAGLPEGITHAVGGVQTTWFAFATAVAASLGLDGPVLPVHDSELSRPALRPMDARLAPALLPGFPESMEAWLGRLQGASPGGR
jgi:dTDP-4-dehydrorhamnose reductase